MKTTLRILLLAGIWLTIEHYAEKSGTPIPKPNGYTLIAIGISLAGVLVAWAIDGLAESVGAVAKAWREFNETVQAMRKGEQG